jgi:hypothetical protein
MNVIKRAGNCPEDFLKFSRHDLEETKGGDLQKGIFYCFNGSMRMA